MEAMDEVFRAINDPGRRILLDALYERDGQTLGELTGLLPDMTRFGVMNHLRVLEEAGLVTTRKQGRSKYHYLNPVPIKLIHDRWITKYAEPRVGAITGIKARLETGEQKQMERPAHVYKAFIKATVEEVWDAIVNPDMTSQYFYGTLVDSDWEVGSEMNYFYPDGRKASEGHIISIDAPKRLEFTFQALWDEALIAEGPAREVWALAEVNGMVQLTVELYDIGLDSKTLDDFANGLPYIISGLKSLVETGEALPSPA
ncbi:MAG: SRPBCC domain-containing protein [Acidimicrobiia bacterium]|nr:SRPBCC domain-containing protein [Acidimicrobiia bacterium]